MVLRLSPKMCYTVILLLLPLFAANYSIVPKVLILEEEVILLRMLYVIKWRNLTDYVMLFT